MDAETKLRISGIPPYDGEYTVLDEAFSAREWRWIKQISGGDLRPGTLLESWDDPDVLISLAVIGMRRAGKITADQVLEVADKLADAPLDDAHIALILPPEVPDEVPLELTSEPSEASTNDSLENEHSPKDSSENSGNDLRIVSAPSEESLPPTGTTR